MRLVRMHPEMMQVDTTHDTNNEKKFAMTSTDGNNKAFNACRRYLPNAQKMGIYDTITTLSASILRDPHM